MRAALIVPTVAALVLAAASPATAAVLPGPGTAAAPAAGWSPWRSVPADPTTLRACGTTIRLTFPVNGEQQRTRALPAGATAIQVRGPLRVRFTPVDRPERAIGRDISGQTLGSDYSIRYANGSSLYRATGHNLFVSRPSEQASSGLPELAITYGPVGIFYHDSAAGPQANVVTRPYAVADVCRLLAG
jgi:hypothetical protein